jgi:hypothetical protein
MMIRGQILDCAVAGDVPDFEEQELPPLGECPACGALNEPIGKLGNVAHFTCRCCGMWFNDSEQE